MSPSDAGVLPGFGGVEISYQIDGAADLPWLILSNSLATDRRMWDPQITELSRFRRVLRYDTRGHGQSQAVPGPYTFEQLTGDVLALCDEIGIEKADFLGLSLGGMTGLALAIRAPERVQKLICCDARAFAPEAYRGIWDANIARLKDDGISALVEPTIERWFTSGFAVNPTNANTLRTVRSMISETSAEGYEGVARLLQALDLQKDLAKIRSETLYVAGEADMAAPVDVMREMASQTPGASFAVLSDAAHLSNMEQPEAFALHISEFLRP